MTESEVETVLLDVVRKYTQNDAVTADARFDKDLHLSDAARQMLFASLAQAFAARGANLPSYRFYMSDFLTCPTPAAVRDAIRAKVFRATVPKAAAAAAPPAEKAKPAEPKAKGAARTAAAKKKPAPKKASGGAKGRRGKS
jgi:hypothetical protein